MDPANAGWRRDLGAARTRLGDVYARQGEHQAALAAYGEGVAIARELVALDPRNALWKRDLTIHLNSVARIQRKLSEHAAAQEAIAESVRNANALVAQEPDVAKRQIAQVASYDRLSVVEPGRARHWINAALVVLRRLDRQGDLQVGQQAWITTLERDHDNAPPVADSE